MKSVSIMLFAALCAVAGASQSAESTNCHARGGCRMVPPVPPIPPTPPAPPEPPAPPVPPEPPPLPAIPDEAHASCRDKAVGSSVTWTDHKGLRISGSCERDAKGMYLDATSIESRQ